MLLNDISRIVEEMKTLSNGRTANLERLVQAHTTEIEKKEHELTAQVTRAKSDCNHRIAQIEASRELTMREMKTRLEASERAHYNALREARI